MDLYVRHDISRLLNRITRLLTDEGVAAYLVGGFVRDILLKRDTNDIDIAVDGDGLDIARRAADALDGSYVALDEENGIGRAVIYNDDNSRIYIDFSTLRGTLENDLSERDFTINAMAIKLSEDLNVIFDAVNIIDPFNGRHDLERGIIITVNDNVFKDDAIRLLRAVRIAAELEFNIDSGTAELIRRDAELITGIAGERIREELLRLLALPGAGAHISCLDRLGLLTAVFPELIPARGLDQRFIHFWDVFEHSMQTVSAIEAVLYESNWEHASRDSLAIVPWSDDLQRHFDSEISGGGGTRRSLLKLAALLHDVAKPETRTVDEDGRTRFIGHSLAGSEIAVEILERLRFGNREIKYIELLIKHHLRPTQMSQEGLPTRRAIYRFFKDTGESYIDVLYLCLADHLATRGRELDMDNWKEHIQLTEYVMNAHNEEKTLSAPAKLVDGNDIMKHFGMEPGPVIGEVLDTLAEAQAIGEITTRQQAIEYIGSLLEEKYPARTGKTIRKTR